jgi:hypothetical protein
MGGKMVKTELVSLMIVLSTFCLAGRASADPNLTIYELQYTTYPNGNSHWEGQIVDCAGGIVIHKTLPGIRPKLTLYDPNYPYGWGCITAKDPDLEGVFDDVNIGDWVSFTNMFVEEFRGNTLLLYLVVNDSNLAILSRNNPLPRPLPLRVDGIAAPIEEDDSCLVADRRSEKYEAMLIKVIDVIVQDDGKGKACDNYILQSNVDPNLTCWASDYMNIDIEGIYHPYVKVGQNFCGVTGIVEQYVGEKDGIVYDYYQLLTTCTEDFTIEQIADFDNDCDVDFPDFSAFAEHWLQSGCTEPDWCGGADLVHDANAIVDMFDLREFTQNWLEGKY